MVLEADESLIDQFDLFEHEQVTHLSPRPPETQSIAASLPPPAEDGKLIISASKLSCRMSDTPLDDVRGFTKSPIYPKSSSNGIETEFGLPAPNHEHVLREFTAGPHSRQASRTSDTSMPDFTCHCDPAENGAGRVLRPSIYSRSTATTQRMQDSRYLRGKAFLNLREELQSNKRELRMALEKFENAKSNARKEKEAKDLAIAENRNLKLQIARLEKTTQQLISDKITQEALPNRKTSVGDKGNDQPSRNRFSSIKSPLPLRTTSGTTTPSLDGSSNRTSRANTSHGSSDNLSSLNISIDESHGRSISLVSRSRSGSVTSNAPEGLSRQIKRKISSIFRPHREGKDDAIPPLPPSPIRQKWAPVHEDVRKRLTMDSGYADSGYASLDIGCTPRTSFVDADYEQLEAI
jgi:hypothetical protein